MKKILLLITTFLLLINFSYAIDLSAVTVIAPASPMCPANNVTITVRIRNNTGVPIDFSVNPVTVSVNITGASTQNFSIVKNTGTLNGTTVTSVTVTALADLTTVGIHSFAIATSVVGDTDNSNDGTNEDIEVQIPTMTLTSAVGTDAQTVCVGVPITDITYAVGGSATSASLVGALPAGVSGSFAAGVFTITGTPSSSVGSPFGYTVSSTGGLCVPQIDLMGSITVTDAATADAGLPADVVCAGDDYTLDGTATNGTILWTTSGTGTFDDDTAEDPIYSPSGADIIGGVVTLTMTVSNAPCVDGVDNIVLTINSTPSASDAGPATDNICSTATYTATATAGAGTILWTSDGDGVFTDPSIEDAEYTPGAGDITGGTVTLTMTVTSVPCPAATDDVVLTVTAAPTADAGLPADVICSGDDYTLDGTATNGTILWSTSGTGTFDDATLEDPIYTPSGADIIAGVITLTMTVSNAPCVDATDFITITINTLIPTADAGPATDVVCEGADFTAAATATNGTILWTSSGSGTFADATIEDAVYTPSPADITAGTVTLTMTVTSAPCPDAVDDIVITISETPTADAGLPADVMCSTGTYTADATAGPGSIMWTSSGAGVFVDPTVEDAVYTPSAAELIAGTFTLTMTVSNAPCVDATDNVIVTINDAPTADAGPATDVICNGSTFTLAATATNGTILWTSTGTGIFDDNTLEDPTYTPSVADETAGTVTLTMTVTNAPCPDAVDDLVLTINADPTADAGLPADLVCVGQDYTASATAGPGTILWTTSGTGTFADATIEDAVYTPSPADDLAGVVTLTMTVSNAPCVAANDNVVLTINGLAPTADAGPAADAICDIDTYTATATAANGTILWTTSGTGTFTDDTAEDAEYTPSPADILAGTVTLTLTVTSAPCNPATDDVVLTIDASPTADAGAATDDICEGYDYTASATAGTGTIVWSTNGTGTFADGTIEDAVYTPSGADITAGVVTLTMTVSNGSCLDASDDVVVTINTLPTADAGAATDDVCEGADYTASATAGTGTIAWTTDGTGTFADATIEDAVYTPDAGDIALGTVTLTMTVSNTSCVDATDDVLVTINAAPTADAGAATDEICEGDDYTAAATATNGTIMWTTSGGGSFADATIEDAVYTPDAGDIALGTVTLTMTVSNAFCADDQDDVVLTINSLPTFTLNPVHPDACGASTGTITISTLIPGESYDITYEDDGVPIVVATTVANGLGDIVISGLDAGTYDNFSITQTSTTCAGVDLVGTTLNNPGAPDINAIADQALCDVDGGYTLVAITGSNLNTPEYYSAAGGVGPTIPVGTVINATTTIYMYDALGACTDEKSFDVTISTTPTADAGLAADDVCAGTDYTAAATAGTGTIAWTTSGTGTFADATIEDAVYTPSGADIIAGVVTLTMTVSNGTCAPAVDDVIVTIQSAPVADAGLPADVICAGSNYTASATAANGTILWTSTGTGTFADATIEDAVYTPSIADVTAGTITLSMAVSNAFCVAATDNVIVSINAVPTADAGAATDNVCAGSDYTASATAGTGTILWTTSGTGTFADATIEDAVYTPSGADITAGVVTLTMTVSNAPCASANDDVIVTINAATTADAGPANDAICEGDTYTAAATVANGNILWTTSGTGTFVDATIEDAVYTPSVADITAGTITLSVNVSNAFCADAIDDVIVTINAAPVFTVNGNDPNTCGASDGDITIGGLIAGQDYDITYDDDAVPTVFPTTMANGSSEIVITGLDAGIYDNFSVTQTIPGCAGTNVTVITLDNPGAPDIDAIADQTLCDVDGGYTLVAITGSNLNTPAYYGLPAGAGASIPVGTVINATQTIYIYDAIGLCTDQQIFTVTINTTPTADAGPATDDVCAGTDYTAAATAGTGTIAWTSSGAGTFANATVEDAVYTPDAADIALGTVTLTMTVSNGTCADAVDNVVVTINVAPTADAGPATDAICDIDTYTAAATAANGTILWSTSGTGAFADATIEDAVYTPDAADIALGTVTLTMTVSNAFCVDAVDNVVLTIDATPTADAGPATDDVCAGSDYTAVATAGTGTIAWTSSGTGTFADASVEDAVYTPDAADIALGTVTLTMTVSNGTCADAVDNVVVTINVAPTADAGSATDAICDIDTYTAAATAANGTILWSTSGTGAFADATIEDAVYTPDAADIALGTVTLTMTVSNAFCVDAVDNVVLTIDATPTADAGPATDDVCAGSDYTAVATAGTGTIAWTSSGTGTFADASVEDAVYTPDAADIALGTVTLTMTVSNGTCADAIDNVVVTINAAPTADAGPATDAICDIDTYTAAATAANGTILWSTSGTGAFADATIEDAVYTPDAADIALGTVTLTMTVSNAFCVDAVDNVVLTIDATPTADAGPATDDVCAGSDYTAAATAGTGTIAWTSSGTGTFADASVEDAVYTPDAADIALGTVTLTMTVSNGACVDAVDNVVVTINAAPTSDAGAATDDVCETDFYVCSATAANGTIAWTSTGTGIFADATVEDAIYTPSVADITAGTVTLTMTVSNAFCANDQDGLVLTIQPAPTADAGLAAEAICAGTDYTAAATATNGTIAWTSTGTGTFADATIEDAVYTPSVADITAGTVTLTMTVSNAPCADEFDDVVLTIDPTPSIAPRTATTCTGLAFSEVPVDGADIVPAGTTYDWAIPAMDAGIAGGAAGAIQVSIDGTLTNSTSAAATATYTVTPTAGLCAGTPFDIVVTVNPTPVVADETAASCSGNAFTVAPVDGGLNTVPAGIQYDWAMPIVPLGVSGEAAGVAQADINGNLTNISAVPEIVNYTVTPSFAGCIGLDFNVAVTVDPASTIALSSAVGTDAQAVCFNSAVTDVVFTIGGGATSASITAGVLPLGVTGTLVGNVFTISGTPTEVGSFAYTVETAGGSCGSVFLTGTLDVIQQVVGLTSASFSNAQEICLGNAITDITYDVSGGAIGAVDTDLPAGVTGSYAAGVYTITGIPTVLGTFFYTVTTTGACAGATAIGSIRINPVLAANTSGASATVCEGTSATLTGGTVTGGNGTYSYLWESSAVSGGPYTPAAGINNAANYTITSASGTMFYIRTVTSGGCSDIAAEVSVTVDPAPTASASGGTTTICSSETATVVGATASNGTIVWTHDGAGTITNGTTLAPTYTPTIVDAGKTITLTMTVTGTNSCGTVTATDIYTVVVNPMPTALAGGTAVVCTNDSVTVTNASATNGTVTWTHNGLGTLSNATTLTPTYTPALGDAGTNVVLTMTVTSTLACAPPIAPTAIFTITVNALPAVPVFAGNDDTLSLGNSVQLTAVGSAIVTYEWTPALTLNNAYVFNPTATPMTTTTYTVVGTAFNGCSTTDSVTIVVEEDFNLIISNLMTPNGDGKNDTWGIQNIENYPNTEVIVINREGQVVFEDLNYSNNWDGKYNGNLLPDATYYYIVKFASSDTVYKGAITLLQAGNK